MSHSLGSGRRLAAICFADIVGYTSRSARDEAGALELVRLLQEVAKAEVEARGGRVVKSLGDAVLAAFPGVEAALDATLAVVTVFGSRAATLHPAPVLRAGLHLGETTVAEDGDVYGDVVNTAARLQGAAEPGTVLVSEDVWRQLRRRPAFHFTEAGVREMKGLETPLATYTAERRYGGPATGPPAGNAGPEVRRRLAVVPFHVVRPDPDVDFLAFALADAVACALMGLPGLVVRSTASLLTYSAGPVDPVRVGREAGVDLVLSGTVARSGDQVRVAARLAEGDTGRLLWSETATVAVGSLFDIQDDLSHRIVASLRVPLDAGGEKSLEQDRPRAGPAYELYLRANQRSIQEGDWIGGVELYGAALEADPSYAPAWAGLGRCHRLLGKYAPDLPRMQEHLRRAEQALGRGVELNPGLPLAQSILAQHEVESGRCVEGMVRLLEQVARTGLAVDSCVGLTHACRYCGLLEASVAAHERAVALDPAAVTSVPFTFLLRGEYERAVEVGGWNAFSSIHAFVHLGRTREALRCLEAVRVEGRGAGIDHFVEALEAVARRDAPRAPALARKAAAHFPDPEGIYLLGAHLVTLGHLEEGLAMVAEAVHRGFHCPDGLRLDPALAPVRGGIEYGAVLERAEAATAAARGAFEAHRGPALLGAGAGSSGD